MLEAYTQWTIPSFDYEILVPRIVLTVTLVSAFGIYLFFFFDTDPPVTFEVEVPEQCRPGWDQKAEILETPSIKVCEVYYVAYSRLKGGIAEK